MTTPEETITSDGDPARGGVAHDLRGRLNTIVSCVRVLRNGGVSQDEALDVIERTAREMTVLLSNLLSPSAGPESRNEQNTPRKHARPDP